MNTMTPAFRSFHQISTVAIRRVALLAGVSVLLGGCATFSADGGIGTAQTIAYTDLNKDVVKITDDAVAGSAKARVDQLLKKPLTADSAVQIALLSNRGLQAAFNELGIAEAQMVAASLPPNPRFGISKLSGRFEVEIERQIVGSLFALVTWPARAAWRRSRPRRDDHARACIAHYPTREIRNSTP